MISLPLAAFNHLLKQHPERRHALAAFAGRRITLQLPLFQVSGVVMSEGFLAQAQGEPEAHITLNPSALFKRVSGQTLTHHDAVLAGDHDLALAVAKILAGLRWDLSEELSRWLGDVPASRIERRLQQGWQYQKDLQQRLVANVVEYLRDEQSVLANQTAVRAWGREVDELRDATARLEKRLEQLDRRLSDS